MHVVRTTGDASQLVQTFTYDNLSRFWENVCPQDSTSFCYSFDHWSHTLAYLHVEPVQVLARFIIFKRGPGR